MNTHFTHRVVCLLAVIAVTLFSVVATPAYAQRDAGAKARGEFGTGFSNPRSQSRSYSPVETRRSFSYEPAETFTGCHCTGAQSAPAERAAALPQAERRSFSYEPSYRSYRSYSAPKKAPWQYPKTDPRRYQP